MFTESKQSFPKISNKPSNIFKKINSIWVVFIVLVCGLSIFASSIIIKNIDKNETALAAPACSVGYYDINDQKCHENIIAPNLCFDFTNPDANNNCSYGNLPLFDCIFNTPGQTEVWSSPGGDQKHLCTKTPSFFKSSSCTTKTNNQNSSIKNSAWWSATMNYYKDTSNNFDGIFNSDNMCSDNTNGCYAQGFRPFLINTRQNHNMSVQNVNFLCINKAFQDGSYYHSQAIPVYSNFGAFFDTSYGTCEATSGFVTIAQMANANGYNEKTNLCIPSNGTHQASLKSCATTYNYFKYNGVDYCGRAFAPNGFTCPAGQGLTNINTDSCVNCSAGYYCPGGVGNGLNVCPANNYCVANSVSPSPCGSGKVSPAGSIAQSLCVLSASSSTILNLKVLLAGAFDDNQDQMNNNLRVLNKIPQNQPYNSGRFNWQGGETIDLGNLKNNIVDWVLVTVRNPYTNAYVASKAGILKTDGTIIDPEHAGVGDIVAGLRVNGISATENYKIVIQHRNHIGVSTAIPVPVTQSSVITVDFSNNSNAKLNSQITVGSIDGLMVYGLRSADSSGDGAVDALDRSVLGNSSEINNVYDVRDVNNDGVVDALDRSIIMNSNEAQENVDFTVSSTAAVSSSVSSSTTITSQPTITSLPLGDGKIGLGSQVGYVKACSLTFPPVGGAFADGPWIKSNGTWDPSIKIAVQGNVSWSNRNYAISLNSGANTRNITTNDLPDHSTGTFPVATNDPAYNFDRNPNPINPQNIVKSLNANPTVGSTTTCLPMGAIGIMKSGVVLFNALDGGGKDAVAHEIQDSCNGHPERQGEYHYHNLSKCIAAQNTTRSTKLVGYAFDGFGIYEEFDATGARLKNADLDLCHGRVSNVEWDGQTKSMYHYVATEEYPYTLGCFQGTPQ